MSQKRRVRETAVGIPKTIAISVVVSSIVTLLGIVLSAYLIHKEVIKQENVGMAVFTVLLISGAVGAFTAIGLLKRMKIQMILISGGAYFLLLLSITALFFGGQYEGVVSGFAGVLSGCGIVIITCILSGGKDGRIKRKKAYR